MSTVDYIKARELRPGDVVLVDSSMIIIESIEPDEWDEDVFIVETSCASGNMEQWNGTSCRWAGSDDRRVLDLAR
jgi:hypothetical protein